MFNTNFADDSIRTAGLWCWKRPFYLPASCSTTTALPSIKLVYLLVITINVIDVVVGRIKLSKHFSFSFYLPKARSRGTFGPKFRRLHFESFQFVLKQKYLSSSNVFKNFLSTKCDSYRVAKE